MASELFFVWDNEKNILNTKKHGISFEMAANVFFDDNRIEIYDRWHPEEERYNVIGLVEDVIIVVYTERRNHIRIISARPATKEERGLYYGCDI